MTRKKQPAKSSNIKTKKKKDRKYFITIFFLFITFLLLFSLYNDFLKQKWIHFDQRSEKQARDIKEKQKKAKIKEHAKYLPFEKKKQLMPPGKRSIPEKERKIITVPDKEIQRRDALPKVAIVIDDLGLSKQNAIKLFNIKGSLTYSILPGRPYSRWVAEEVYKRGFDIMVHVPMEPLNSKNRLGIGGLYTRMSKKEIQTVLNKDLESIPYVIGFNNHMGSLFTSDRRAMDDAISGITKKNVFFLDSMTTSNSIAASSAKAHGLKTFKRDVFLDHSNEPGFIESQWERLVEIAQKKGQAIAIGHPHENTIKFLNKTIPSDEFNIVPLSKLKGL